MQVVEVTTRLACARFIIVVGQIARLFVGESSFAAAEGEIARNLSGKRTANGLDTLESRGLRPAPKV